jgi:hypothetical protein
MQDRCSLLEDACVLACVQGLRSRCARRAHVGAPWTQAATRRPWAGYVRNGCGLRELCMGNLIVGEMSFQLIGALRPLIGRIKKTRSRGDHDGVPMKRPKTPS